MAATRLADVIVPEVFDPEVIERTSEKIAFIQSGVAQPVNNITIGEGKTIQLPFYQDLSGDDAVWDDTDDITLNKIGMGQDTAAVTTREKAFASTDLARALSGSDPMDAIAELVAGYWSRRYQTTLINIVTGMLSAANMTANALDISTLSGAASDIDGESFVDATQRLGDHSDALTDMLVHSATEASLRKQDLIDFIPDSEGKLTIRTFQGRVVHIDDSAPVSSTVYTTFLFGQGAVSFVDELVENANEPYRHPEKNGGTDALYTRRKYIMHPRGVKWNPASGVPASATPSNAEFADGANWTRVYEPQNIRMVKFDHTLAS